MYVLFSALLRKILLNLAVILLRIASGSFEFKKVYYDNNTESLIVIFKHQGMEIQEKFNNFVKTDYFRMLTKRNLKTILDAKIEMVLSNKIITLHEDISCPDIMTVYNKITQQQESLLVKDIFNNDYYLENMNAKDIRVIAQSLLKEDDFNISSITNTEINNVIPLVTRK